MALSPWGAGGRSGRGSLQKVPKTGKHSFTRLDDAPREGAVGIGLVTDTRGSLRFGSGVDGLVAARAAGRTRLYRLNPRYFAREELGKYLQRLASAETDLVERTTKLRRRPRRAGKPL
jgi:hypothetical protein